MKFTDIETIIIIALIAIIGLVYCISIIKMNNKIKSLTTKLDDKGTDKPTDSFVQIEKNRFIIENYKKINEMIDYFVKEAAERYIIFNVPDPEDYINSKKQNEMVNYIYGSLVRQMTPSVLNMIECTNNIRSQKDLQEFLLLHIKIYVLGYVVNKNKPL